ncbi:hypothetical protein D3C73_664320 [compost metagenome]
MPVVAARADQVGNLHRHDLHRRLVADKNQRHQVIIPHPEELEDSDGGESRHRQRQNQSAEDREMARAVNKGRFEQILGKLADEVVHEVGNQRQAKGGMRQPDPQITSVQTKRSIVLKHRNQCDLNRDHEHGDNDYEQCFAAREPQPGEGIRGKRGDQHRNDRSRDRNRQRIPEGLRQPRTLLHRFTAVSFREFVLFAGQHIIVIIHSEIRNCLPALLLDINRARSAVLPHQAAVVHLHARLQLVVRVGLAVHLNRLAQIGILRQLQRLALRPLLMGKYLPPAGLQNIRCRTERGNKETQRREQPNEANDAQHEIDDGFAAFSFLFAGHLESPLFTELPQIDKNYRQDCNQEHNSQR